MEGREEIRDFLEGYTRMNRKATERTLNQLARGNKVRIFASHYNSVYVEHS